MVVIVVDTAIIVVTVAPAVDMLILCLVAGGRVGILCADALGLPSTSVLLLLAAKY